MKVSHNKTEWHTEQPLEIFHINTTCNIMNCNFHLYGTNVIIEKNISSPKKNSILLYVSGRQFTIQFNYHLTSL